MVGARYLVPGTWCHIVGCQVGARCLNAKSDAKLVPGTWMPSQCQCSWLCKFCAKISIDRTRKYARSEWDRAVLGAIAERHALQKPIQISIDRATNRAIGRDRANSGARSLRDRRRIDRTLITARSSRDCANFRVIYGHPWIAPLIARSPRDHTRRVSPRNF